jgi:hypothetical protein
MENNHQLTEQYEEMRQNQLERNSSPQTPPSSLTPEIVPETTPGFLGDVLNVASQSISVATATQQVEVQKDKNLAQHVGDAIKSVVGRTPLGKLAKVAKTAKDLNDAKKEQQKSLRATKERILDAATGSIVLGIYQTYHDLPALLQPLAFFCNQIFRLFPGTESKALFFTGIARKHGMEYGYIALHPCLTIPVLLVTTILSWIVLFKLGRFLTRYIKKVIAFLTA